MDNRAIGVFDSGLGGLSAVRKLKELLPHEDIVFLGDTARLPYGSKDQEVIREFARNDMSFLSSKDVKVLVAACGTVSSNILPRDIALFDQPFIGIIKPAAFTAARATRNKKVGLLGTVATVASGTFKQAVEAADPAVTVFPKACPDFVPLIEAGHVSSDDPLLCAAIDAYLTPLVMKGVDTIILGCTHYPLIADAIRSRIPEGILLIDSGAEEAKYVASFLETGNLLSGREEEGTGRFFVTANRENFTGLAPLFIGGDVSGSTVLLSEREFLEP